MIGANTAPAAPTPAMIRVPMPRFDGGSEEKPVGTVWIALAHENGVITRKLTLGGTRMQNIYLSSLACVNLLRRYLLNDLS